MYSCVSIVIVECALSFIQGWSRIVANGGPGQPWPVSRAFHSAVSLYDSDTNPSNPTLMVMWGHGDADEVLNDWWLFGVNTQHWREVRQSVSTTSFSTKQTDTCNIQRRHASILPVTLRTVFLWPFSAGKCFHLTHE